MIIARHVKWKNIKSKGLMLINLVNIFRLKTILEAILVRISNPVSA